MKKTLIGIIDFRQTLPPEVRLSAVVSRLLATIKVSIVIDKRIAYMDRRIIMKLRRIGNVGASTDSAIGRRMSQP
eukprot:4733836-Pleurochrysis_carterae.AAC.2